MGAEALLGQGDMLYLPPGTGLPAARARRVRRRSRGAQGRRLSEDARPAAIRGRRSGESRGGRSGRSVAGEAGGRRVGSALRPGGGDRAQDAARLDLAGAAPSAHRLQPRRAPDRADGSGRHGVCDAVQRQSRSAGAGRPKRSRNLRALSRAILHLFVAAFALGSRRGAPRAFARSTTQTATREFAQTVFGATASCYEQAATGTIHVRAARASSAGNT